MARCILLGTAAAETLMSLVIILLASEIEGQLSAQSNNQSTSSLARTNRQYACVGESLTITCTVDGNGLVWESQPPLGQRRERNMFTFVHLDIPGTKSCYSLAYNNGTMFFASAVLGNIDNNTCTSTMTLTPVPNVDGFYPTFNESFEIICNASDGTSNDGQTWLFEVADLPNRVDMNDITCKHYSNDSLVEVNIKPQNEMNRRFDINLYEIKISDMLKTNVSESEAPSNGNNVTALFWRVESLPEQVQVRILDKCNKWSELVVADCTSHGIATANLMSKISIILVALIGVLAIKIVSCHDA